MQKETDTHVTLDFAIIGVQRGASTWLHEQLKQHPEVCLPSKKESNFFCDDAEYAKGSAYYTNYFSTCKNASVFGEADPNYLFFPSALTRLQTQNPAIKIVILLRHPIDRAWSHFSNHAAKGKNALNRKQFVEMPDNYYLERSHYAPHLQEVFSIFPRENVLVLFFENLAGDPVSFIKKVQKFIGLRDFNFVADEINKTLNKSGHVRARSVRLNHLLYACSAFFSNNPFGKKLSPLLKHLRINSLAKRAHDLNMSPPETYTSAYSAPQLTEAERNLLAPFLERELREVEKILGREIPEWK